MNPLELPGGQFLLFYASSAAVTAFAVWGLRLMVGPAGRPSQRLSDPYAIALLRAGPAEAIRVAATSLVARGLLKRSAAGFTSDQAAEEQFTDPLERTLVRQCSGTSPGWRLLENTMVRSSLAPRQRELEALGLIPDQGQRIQLALIGWAGVAAMAGIAVGKILTAVAHGHSNVEGLIVLSILAVALMVVIAAHPPHATPRGRTVLSELGALFGALRSHRVSQRAEETVFLAALFGATVLPSGDQAAMKRTFTKPQTQGSSSGCSSSGCGSGGGGGGCGGGCGGGGCGGCGS
jgi:uncharacterized protein (TIGR04222 family)